MQSRGHYSQKEGPGSLRGTAKGLQQWKEDIPQVQGCDMEAPSGMWWTQEIHADVGAVSLSFSVLHRVWHGSSLGENRCPESHTSIQNKLCQPAEPQNDSLAMAPKSSVIRTVCY